MSKKRKKKKWQNQPGEDNSLSVELKSEQPEVSAVLLVGDENFAKTLENVLPDQNKQLNLVINEPKKSWPWKGILWFILGIALLVGLNFCLQYGISYYFKDKILPGIVVNGTKLDYLSYDEAWQILNNRWESYWQSAHWEIFDKPAPVTAFPSEDENLATKDDIVVLKFSAVDNYCSLDKQILYEKVFSYGQNQWWLKSLPLLWQNKEFAIPLTCDKAALMSFLKDNLNSLESPSKNAYYQFDASGNLSIVEGTVGRVIDYDDLLNQVKNQLPLMQNLRLSLKWQIEDPQVRGSDLQAFKEQYLKYLEINIDLQLPKWNSGLDLVAVTRSYDDMRNSNPEDLTKYYDSDKDIYIFDKKDFRIAVETLAAKEENLVTVATFQVKNFANDFVFYKNDQNQLKLKINEEDLAKWVTDLNKNIKIDAVAAVLEMEEVPAPVDNESGATEATKKYRVTKFVSPKSGRALKVEETVSLLNSIFDLWEIPETLSLPMQVLNTVDESLPNNPLKIKELLGLGVSNFSGSPANRIHNIKTGASKLNGLLLAPGEEFKTIINLKPFDARGGYLPELVIKGTETIPEYGGGLCQVGTTLFRAAIDAGLPITERRPHRYDVSYYKPTGTDATIYDPHPDVRFINDTGNYILFQAYTSGYNLYVELWGVSDGRLVEKTDPIQYNYVYPPAAKYIDTTDLPKGVIKQKETPHIGVTGEFWWRVVYPDGKVYFKKWISKYSPWQQVFLRGVDALPTDSSSTEVPDDTGSTLTTPSDDLTTVVPAT